MAIPQSEINAAANMAQGLDGAPEVNQTFTQRADRSATEPVETPTPGPPPSLAEGRPTSIAKKLDEIREGSPLPANDSQVQQQGQGSKMIEEDQPKPEPSNTTPEAAAVKREQFNEAWAAEQARADEYQQAIEEAAEMAQEIEARDAQELNQDRGNGMSM